jgi:hypothetical protein
MPTLEVVCPDGVGEGALLQCSTAGGGSIEVTVPAGVCAGDVFLVDHPTELPPIDAFMQETAQFMDGGSAELLRAVLQALHDDERLDEFVDDHSEKFRDYDQSQEQSLEWGSLHTEYVALVEGSLETVLASGRGNAEDLYALLESHRHSSRGQRFLNKFLSMGDYDTFCSMMCTWTRLETTRAQSRYIDDEQAAIDEL